MPTKQSLAVVLLLVVSLVGARRVAQANPVSCCQLSPSGANPMTMTVIVRRTCLAAGATCPDISTLELHKDDQPIPVVWLLVEEATKCVYTTQLPAPAQYTRYTIEVPYEMGTCSSGTSVGHPPDLGAPDRMIAPDAAGKDAAADARQTPPPGGGDGSCTIGAGSRFGSSLPMLLLGLALLLALRRCDRRRDH